jgi:hypothetical protein
MKRSRSGISEWTNLIPMLVIEACYSVFSAAASAIKVKVYNDSDSVRFVL